MKKRMPNIIYILLVFILVLSSFVFVTISDDDINYEPMGTPSVTTNATTNVEETTATLHGYLSDDGGGCNVKFQYGTTTGYGSSTTNQSKSSGDEFSAGISSLSEGTLYHCRAVATTKPNVVLTNWDDENVGNSSGTSGEIQFTCIKNSNHWKVSNDWSKSGSNSFFIDAIPGASSPSGWWNLTESYSYMSEISLWFNFSTISAGGSEYQIDFKNSTGTTVLSFHVDAIAEDAFCFKNDSTWTTLESGIDGDIRRLVVTHNTGNQMTYKFYNNAGGLVASKTGYTAGNNTWVNFSSILFDIGGTFFAGRITMYLDDLNITAGTSTAYGSDKTFLTKPTWYSGFLYRKSIVIDHTKIDSTLTNFPLLVNLVEDSGLASYAQSDGDDICFVGSDNATKLSYDLEKYENTGNLTVWVNVTSISNSTDTLIWMYYGNATCGSQSNVDGVWGSYYIVYHMNDNSTSTISDVTTNSINGTKISANNPIQNSSGWIADCQTFDGDHDYIQVGDSTQLRYVIDINYTVSFWARMDGNNTPDNRSYQAPFDFRGGGAVKGGIWFNFYENIGWYSEKVGFWRDELPLSSNITGESNSNKTWYYFTCKSTDATRYLYRNGIYVGNVSVGTAGTQNYQDRLGCLAFDSKDAGFSGYKGSLNGSIDEFRITNFSRSGDWIKASFHSQNQTTGFITTGNDEYQHNNHTTITINHSLIDSDLTNFPMLVNLSNDIVSRADGGNSTRFYDSNSIPLAYEIDKWNNSGCAYIWVNVTSISSTVDTVFHLYYNNSNATDAQNPHGVWNSNYVMVQHMNDYNTSAIHDSTSNYNNGTKKAINEPIINSSGKIGNSQDFDGNNDYIDCGNNENMNFERTDNFSCSAWIKLKNIGADKVIFSRRQSSGTRGYIFYVTVNDELEVVLQNTNTNRIRTAGGTALSAGVWYYVAFSYNGNSSWSGVKLYVDGIEETEVNVADTLSATIQSTGDFQIGDQTVLPLPMDGTIDENRVSKITCNDSWIKTSFHSQNQTLGFLTYKTLAEIDTEVSPSTWTAGNINIGTSARENFTFWQNGTNNIDITITVNDTNYTFVNWSQWLSFGHDHFCGNFTTNSWSSETTIEPSYPSTSILKSNFHTGNFVFGVRMWMPRTTTNYPSKQENFSIILTVQEHT